MTDKQLITIHDPTSAAAEAYRTLRINIEFANVDNPIKTLLVTSAGANDDKDVTIANLAVTLADGGQKIILVDSDLRRPMLHTLFGLNNQHGFTDMFRDESAFNKPPCQTITDMTLQVLSSGTLPKIPSQILNSTKLVSVIEQLRSMADMVLFTAPPLMMATDAALLASKVDATLLVVKTNVSKREHVLGAKSRLARVNANLIGAVLANAPVDSSLQY